MVKCALCSAEAIARFSMDAGCVCKPEDLEQALCLQHIVRSSPLGSMDLVEVLRPDVWDWYLSTR